MDVGHAGVDGLAVDAADVRPSVMARLFPPWTWSVHWVVLAVAAGAAVGVGIMTAIVVAQPYIPVDDSIDRAIQSTNWGPAALTFPFFSWLGDAKGALVLAGAFVLVLLLNRRAWLLALLGASSGIWYILLSHLVLRPRPTTAQVLRVTEHPGASSFPSGHTVFIVTLTALLMLCLGYRFLPRWARPAGWASVAAIVVACAISRVYVGAHWPTDVLTGMLIGTAWLSLVV